MDATSKSLAADTNFIGAKEDPNKYLRPTYETPRVPEEPTVQLIESTTIPVPSF